MVSALDESLEAIEKTKPKQNKNKTSFGWCRSSGSDQHLVKTTDEEFFFCCDFVDTLHLVKYTRYGTPLEV